MVYLGVTLFCVVFFLIYNQFSHGIHSPFMTFLFAWPLCLGLIPSLILWKIPGTMGPGRVSANLYHSGVAAVTVSSLLRGIFDIAGTSSNLQVYLMIAGVAFLVCGVLAWAVKK